MELSHNILINMAQTDTDLLLIFTSNLGEVNKQKCQDYIKDQNREKELCMSFVICDDDNNSGNFYFSKDEIDLLSINDLLTLLGKLTTFLNKNNIKWEGNKIRFELTRNSPDFFISLGPGIGSITKNKFILAYFYNENNITKTEFDLK